MGSFMTFRLQSILIAIAASLITHLLTDASAAQSEKKLELTGTITAIYPVRANPPSKRNWAVTIRVEKVKEGEYSKPEFTFTIHSPALARLAVGGCCAIEATWTGQEYSVNKTLPIKCESARR
jgi:hypothetical protein